MRLDTPLCSATLLLSWFLIVPDAEPLSAAELKLETVRAWDGYVQAAQAEMKERIRTGNFLWVDEKAERRRDVRSGMTLVAPMGAHCPTSVPNGLIHHWIGAAFLPHVTVDDVFSVLRDYGRYKEFYRPIVVDSKPLSPTGADDRFSMIVLNRVLFARNAMDSDYQGSYIQIDGRRWYNITYSTRVQEVENYGEGSESRLAEGTGSGYIWRLYSISRFEERDGGVYVELEAMALSRDIPVSLRWLVNPMVRRISRSSLLTSLEQTRDAVHCVRAVNLTGSGAGHLADVHIPRSTLTKFDHQRGR